RKRRLKGHASGCIAGAAFESVPPSLQAVQGCGGRRPLPPSAPVFPSRICAAVPGLSAVARGGLEAGRRPGPAGPRPRDPGNRPMHCHPPRPAPHQRWKPMPSHRKTGAADRHGRSERWQPIRAWHGPPPAQPTATPYRRPRRRHHATTRKRSGHAIHARRGTRTRIGAPHAVEREHGAEQAHAVPPAPPRHVSARARHGPVGTRKAVTAHPKRAAWRAWRTDIIEKAV
ncbi:conserved hypothetical protein, partial [Ricinus communis]